MSAFKNANCQVFSNDSTTIIPFSISCSSCKNCLLSQFNPATPDHEYCSIKFSEVASVSAFTLFVNNGGLRIPSESVYLVVEYAEKEFKACVCKDGNQITREAN